MRLFQYALITCFLLAHSATAMPLPKPQAQYLKVYWHGFHVASLIAGWERTRNGQILSHAIINTYGLAKTVSRYHSDSISLSEGGEPVKFKTTFSHHKSAREIVLEWRDFTIVKEHNEPPEKPGKRTPVPEQMKDQAYDPLTVFFAARAKLIEGETKFTLPMYDGRRRSELYFKLLGKREDGTLEVTMREIFLAGYTRREQEERAKRDITIHIYLDPQTYIPVGGEAQSVIGEATAKLGAVCNTFKECLIAAEMD